MERIGLAISGGLAPLDIVECVTLAEALGYESAWVAEGHGGDQFAILTACALSTSRILLGTSISSVFVRSVPTMAMAAATVDHLSQHRFLLGLGSSHKVQVEPEHGLPYGKPIQRVRDSVAIIRLMAESGFAEAAQAIRTAWARGDQAGATRAVPDALIAATGVVGTAAECRERLAAYRHSGIALPIISPWSRGPQGKQRAIEAIKACAP
jgi:alkanesulfonate monooxygenase SsuD/methylene tetrahydromethanopterin reductase-like flavin-dependent oxidoreductase (luciferase family)